MKYVKSLATCSLVILALATWKYAPVQNVTACQSVAPVKTVNTESIESLIGRRFVSRTPVNAYVPSARPLEGMTIIVDPGHGGQESKRIRNLNATGATGNATRQLEKDINLRVSLLLRYYLQHAGASVYMTRTNDSYADGMCVGMNGEKERCERAYLANRNRANMFVSVHHDSAPRTSANHSTVIYNGGNRLSNPLADSVAVALNSFLGNRTSGAKKNKDLTVLSKLTVPGILVECSFMSNVAEDRRLANIAYNKLEAKAIAVGILNYTKYTLGKNVDFASLFQPIDEQWSKTASVADRCCAPSSSLIQAPMAIASQLLNSDLVAPHSMNNIAMNSSKSASNPMSSKASGDKSVSSKPSSASSAKSSNKTTTQSTKKTTSSSQSNKSTSIPEMKPVTRTTSSAGQTSKKSSTGTKSSSAASSPKAKTTSKKSA